MTKKGKIYEIPVEDGSEEPPAAAGTGDDDLPLRDDLAGTLHPEGAEENDSVRIGGEKSLAEAVDHLRRLQAEFSNYKKRVERERLEMAAWAQGALVEKLLPVLDDFDRAVAALEGEDSPALQGMTLIRDKMVRILTEAGLKRIEAVGNPFDPDLHEALMTEPVEPERVGTVVMEISPGFQFKDRLVRPARVQVGVESE